MLILTYQVRPSATAALQKAVQRAEVDQQIAMTVHTAKDVHTFAREFAVASTVVVDLMTLQMETIIPLLIDRLTDHPFVRTVVVATAQSSLDQQLGFYRLGRIGVSHVVAGDEAETTDYWYTLLSSETGFDVVARAHRHLDRVIDAIPQADLLRRVAPYANVTSVKMLAARLYPGDTYSPASKRRWLWQTFREAGLGAPENVLACIRLVLLKYILNTDEWTVARVARHFGHESPRHLNRSMKNRVGLTLRDIRALPDYEITAHAMRLCHEVTSDVSESAETH
jgi:AraC-like DNA-binding protein